MSNKQPLFFDIETGDFQAERSPVLSISYARGKEVKSLYAAPPPGSFISKWVSENVWEPIRQRLGGDPTRSEESVLREFLGVLESQKGGTVAGWNIGFVPTPQAPSVKGFDVPFLMSRAEKYGLSEQYQKAFSGVNIRDIGREYSVRVATEISRHESLVDPKLFAQAESFSKLIKTNAGIQRLHSVPEIARWMGTPGQYGGYEVAGWRLKNVHKYLFGEEFSSQHLSEADVLATQRIAEQGDPSKMAGPEFASLWNKEALANKVESSARAAAESLGIEGNFVGRAIARGENKAWGSFFRTAGRIAIQHKVGLGIAGGIGLLALTKPLSLFSGKDDEYNTIEGLPHGGMGQEMRRRFTDFGSGWLRKAVSVGASEASIAKAMRIATGAEAKFTVMGGEKWVQMKHLGEGGFGTADLVLGMASGRTGVLKTALREEPLKASAVAGGPLVMRALNKAKILGNTRRMSAIQRFASSYMQDVFKAGEKLGAPGTIGYEVAMQKLARRELGDIVPEVYAQGEMSFIQEYAGTSLSRAMETEGTTRKEAKEALDWMEKTFGKMYGKKQGIAHFDPSLGNITKRGNKYMVIDWGLAAPVEIEAARKRRYMGKTLLSELKKSYHSEISNQLTGTADQIATAIVNTPGRVATPPAGGTMILGNAEKKIHQSQLQRLASKQMSENTARAGKGHRTYTTTSTGRKL